ncbi:MAG: T9SS type A sorting domain-containing protein [Firmicutes bacterium]|nr:T9SS type A sorting domain-containing protein [Bacillota bacterium]
MKTLKKFRLVLLCLFCITFQAQAQTTWCNEDEAHICYEDNQNGLFATENTRVVATIKEFEDNDEVHIECMIIGYIYLGSVALSLEYDPNIVYPINGAGGNEITKNLNGPVNMGNYLWMNPELPGGTGKWLAPSTTGQVNPQLIIGKQNWTFIKCAQLTEQYKLKTEDNGAMQLMFKLFFRKKEGKTLTNETFKYYNRTTLPTTYNEIVHGLTTLRSIGEPAENLFVNEEIFTRRIPSIVKTFDATVNATSITLNGLAKSESIAKIPGGNGLDWDAILETGFIYSKNNVALTIDEYSNKIKINNIEYGFPTTMEANNSFTLGEYTFYMVKTENTENHSMINMSETINGLDVDETYYAYAYMKYKFQTSQEYPVLGEQISFTASQPPVSIDILNKADAKLTVYPNPVVKGSHVTLWLELPENNWQDATAILYDMSGKKIAGYTIHNPTTNITLNVEKGTYILRVRTKNEQEFKTKIMVQ